RKAREAAAQGFRGLKMKCALEDPMVERVQAIAEAAGPDFRITIDPNERFYRPAEALRLARALEGYNVEVFEDPFPKWNVASYVHACAAARSCTLASDIIGNFLREDDLIVEPLQIERGYAVVPQAPGLGVQLDQAALEHYRVP